MLNLIGVHIGSVHYNRLSEDFLIPLEYLLCGLKITFSQLNALNWLENTDISIT